MAQEEEKFEKNSNEQAPGEENQDPDINVDENISGTSHLNEAVQEAPVQEGVSEELQELKEKYLRLVAEFDNYKKRTSRERLELMQTAGRELITSLLDVLDDSDRAILQMENTDNPEVIREGVLLVFAKLKNILQAKGLREMESLHAEFDADLHDAITEIPAPTEELKGKVVDNAQKGYYLNDKIIRHAKVVVGK